MGDCVSLANLSESREELAAQLENLLSATFAIYDHLPDSVTAPCVLIGWSSPWLVRSTFCGWDSKMELLLIAQRLEPGGQLGVLEAMVSTLVVGVGQPFTVESVSAPFPIEIAGNSYLAASIDISNNL